MADKKAIVIKVKYPVGGAKVGTATATSLVVTEWNKKRILGALTGVVLVIFTITYLFNSEEPQDLSSFSSAESQPIAATENQPLANQAPINDSIVRPEIVANTEALDSIQKNNSRVSKSEETKHAVRIKPEARLKNKSKPVNNNVVRALVTGQMNNKEPGAAINRLVVFDKTPTSVYYFNELKQMNGQKVYHEWLKNNKLVSRHELIVAADNWRTSSHKLLSAAGEGQWMVRVIDQTGHVLHENKFKVVLK
ncbi:MAG: DUF2914 domain-containing protein [Methylococcales bacterium]|nr:DUF2914 domain-containing protein [Methylococcales bacterium]